MSKKIKKFKTIAFAGFTVRSYHQKHHEDFTEFAKNHEKEIKREVQIAKMGQGLDDTIDSSILNSCCEALAFTKVYVRFRNGGDGGSNGRKPPNSPKPTPAPQGNRVPEMA